VEGVNNMIEISYPGDARVAGANHSKPVPRTGFSNLLSFLVTADTPKSEQKTGKTLAIFYQVSCFRG
jgi:hypothetical protein